MTYQVMARKWRPQDFGQVISQEHVTRTLQNAIRSERIGHAYLFSGPRGVGKTTVARILAKAINCQEGPTPTPCNRCTTCQEITSGTSMDVLEIDGASNTGVDNIRNLRETIKYAATQGRHKIYIIDEVHMLSESAFNALLKTLEEPPSHVIFIFATTKPQKIPMTILSRCQRFDFRRIPTKLIAQRLSYITEQEQLQVEESALMLIAKKADGSLRDGQSLLDQVISFGGKKITPEEVSEVLGLASRDLFFELIDAVCDRNAKKGLELVATVEEQGWDMEEFIDGLLDHLRHLLLAKTAPDSQELMDLVHADRERYTEQGAQVEEEDLLRMVAIVSDTSRAVRYNSQRRFLLEMMVVQLAKMEATVHLKDLIHDLNRVLGEQGGGKPQMENPEQASSGKTAARPPAPPQAELDGETQELWNQMLTRVRKKKSSLGAILQHGQLAELQNQSLTIVFPTSCNFHLIQAEKQKNRAVIEGEVSTILGKDIQVKFTMADLPESSEKPMASSTPPERKLSVEDVVKAEPILGTILETLDGELME